VTLTIENSVLTTFDIDYPGGTPAAHPEGAGHIGNHIFAVGSTVTVALLDDIWSPNSFTGSGPWYALTGWEGSGSMTNGLGTSTGPFVITEDTTIKWNWSFFTFLNTHVGFEGGGQITGGASRLTSVPTVITATADPGYEFSYWGFDDQDLRERDDVDIYANPITLTSQNGPNRSLYAMFTRNSNIVRVESIVPAVDPSPGDYPVFIDIPDRFPDRFSASASSASFYDADPSDGLRYVLDGWTGTGSIPDGTSATAGPFAIDQPSSITWNWVEEWQITATQSSNGFVTGGDWVRNGSSATLTATPQTGYRFERWTGDLTGLPASAMTSNPLTFSAAGARDISAVFGPVPLTVTVDGTAQEHPYGATLSIQSASPDGSRGIRGVVTGWEGTGSVPATGVGDATTVFVLTENSTVQWTRSLEFELNLPDNMNGGGWFPPGAFATINASAPPGMRFLRWTGDIPAGEEQSQSVTFQMLGPRNISVDLETLYTPAGIPQPWFFENNLGSVDEDGDPDGDRISNAGEYHAGTNPRSAVDFPRIADIRFDPATGRIEWPSKAGHRYTVETATDIDGVWTATMSNLSATAPMNAATLPDNLLTGYRFFRVVTTRE